MQFPVKAIIGAALLISACQQQPAVEGVKDAIVQLPVVMGRPGSAYFTLTGGAADNRLMEISSPQIVRVELHESMKQGEMMTMKPLESGIAIPAGGTIKFEPGGKHAMLFDINPKARPGSKLTLNFSYANGRKIEVQADVKAAGHPGGHQH